MHGMQRIGNAPGTGRLVARALLAAALLVPWGAASGAEPLPLDRALKAAALERDDVKIHLEGRRDPPGSPLFERWMASPLNAPEEGQSMAEQMLSHGLEPHEWLSLLPTLEGRSFSSPKPHPSGTPRPLPSTLPPEARRVVSGLLDALSEAGRGVESAFRKLTPEELEGVERRLFPDGLAPGGGEEPSLPDAKALEETRQAVAASERVDREALLGAAVALTRAAWQAARALSRDRAFLALEHPMRVPTSLGDVLIGSSGADVHEGPALLVVDPGGDDRYLGRVASAGPLKASLVIDLGGNDTYLGEDRTQGAGVMGVGVLLDLEGDDLYRAANGAQGAAVYGVGLLVDAAGDDHYIGDRLVQAASAWGYAGLLDLEGDDLYRCGSERQAYTWLRGAACLSDACGDDRYLSGTGRPDPREPDMHQSFAQGFAMGLRNLCPGGTALLADGGGNDSYQGQYFVQGASYWMGTGVLYDREGRDSFLARRYAQGAGIHFSFGMLLDRSGDDHTVSWGVSQGCGHDLGVGILINESGDDTYAADWLSLGGSEANGIGIFVDNRGRDGYETRAGAGFGRLVPIRRSGGLGLFVDAEGRDRYSRRGSNDHTWFSNRWGVGIDAEAGGESGVNLRRTPERDLPCASRASVTREEEASRLEEILARARAAGPSQHVEGLLSVAAHWGHERDLPAKAREELLAVDPEVSLPVLMGHLDTPSVLERLVLSEVFRVHAFRALPLLEKVAVEARGRARVQALLALGNLRDTRFLPACRKGLTASNPRVRAAAARAVGNILERSRLEALEPLREALEQAREAGTAEPVRRRLTSRGDAESALSVAVRCFPVRYETYERFSGPDDPASGVEALNDLGGFLFEHRDALESRLKAWIEAVRRPDEWAAGLRELLEDESPAVRASAAYALGQLEDPVALDGLLGLLRDPEAPVRDAAGLGLALLGDPAVDPVRRSMVEDDVRSCIIGLDVLGRIDTPRARSRIADFLNHPEGVVRKAAEQALGLRTP